MSDRRNTTKMTTEAANTPDDRHLITAAEATRLCGLTKATLYRLAREGRLRSFQVLSAVRFDRRDVLALARPRPGSSGVDAEQQSSRQD
jgi:excisionase family DNA binding protein